MVKFIESELVLLKKEVDEMWTLVYNQLERAADAVLTSDRELAQQVCVCERRVNAFELKIDSDVEDIIALYNPVAIDHGGACHGRRPDGEVASERDDSPSVVHARTGQARPPGGKPGTGHFRFCQGQPRGRNQRQCSGHPDRIHRPAS